MLLIKQETTFVFQMSGAEVDGLFLALQGYLRRVGARGDVTFPPIQPSEEVKNMYFGLLELLNKHAQVTGGL